MKVDFRMLIATLLLAGCGPSEQKLKDQVEQKEKEALNAQIETLKAKVLDRLNDPVSAQFKNVKLLPDNKGLCGEVNSKNSLGGYGPFTAFAVKPSGQVVILKAMSLNIAMLEEHVAEVFARTAKGNEFHDLISDLVFRKDFAHWDECGSRSGSAVVSRAKEDGINFLVENAKKEGVKVTASGLQYKIIKEGEGRSPTAKDEFTLHYIGMLITGEEFDSSIRRGVPVTFSMGHLTKGLAEGVQLMKPGAKYDFYIPASLGFGERGAGNKIGPNETLIFEVELLEVGSTGKK